MRMFALMALVTAFGLFGGWAASSSTALQEPAQAPGRLRPVEGPTLAQVEACLQDILGAKDSSSRERAAKQLLGWGERARGHLEHLAEGARDKETRKAALEALGGLVERQASKPRVRSSHPLAGRRQSTSISIGSQGVRVEVRAHDADGKEIHEVYEAADLEAFRKEHPDIAEQHGMVGSKGWFGRFELPGRGGLTPPADGPRLGVHVESVEGSGRLARLMGVPLGGALYVSQVMPGSTAAAIDIQPGDLLISVNGRPVAVAADIQRALASVPAEATVTAVVMRGGLSRVDLGSRPR